MNKKPRKPSVTGENHGGGNCKNCGKHLNARDCRNDWKCLRCGHPVK